MTTYTVESSKAERTVRVISDDDEILECSAAMRAIGDEVSRVWGVSADTVGRGHSVMRGGAEVGWEWSVE